MEKEKKQAQGGKVAELPTGCKTQGCKKKTEKDVFCNEHFLWFKAGLVKKDGSFPKDFDKKYIRFMNKAG